MPLQFASPVTSVEKYSHETIMIAGAPIVGGSVTSRPFWKIDGPTDRPTDGHEGSWTNYSFNNINMKLYDLYTFKRS